MKSSTYLATSAAAIAVALCAVPAFAQTATNASATQDTAATTDGDTAQGYDKDIVVVGTAGAGTRRQEAAFAVTSLGADAIKQIAPTSTADVLKAVPGVAVEASGGQNGANIFVRGYPSGGDAVFVTFQSSGTPIFPPPTLSFLENSQLIRIDTTVERVEAVRGGTGSLFSNGQPGLTVNFVQRQGGDVFAGKIEGSYADYNEGRIDGYVSGPLGENTGFMMGGFYHQSHGIRDPQFTAEKGGQFTANVSHDFNNDSSVLVYARYLNDRGQWLLPIPIVQNGKDISGYPGFDPNYGTLASNDVRFTTLNDGSRVDLAKGRGADIVNVGANLTFGLGEGVKLRDRIGYMGGHAFTIGLVPSGPPTTLSAYATGKGGTIGSATYVNGGGTVAASTPIMRAGVWTVDKKINSVVNDASIEFKSSRNTLTGGFYYANYYARDDWNLGNLMLLTATENARRINLTFADGRQVTRDGFDQGSFYRLRASYTGEDVAFYAVDELQITDQLRIDGGVRWQQHRVTGQVNQPTSINRDGNPNTLYDNGDSVTGTVISPISYKNDGWSYTAGVDYEFTRSVGVFGRYSRGVSFPQFDDLRGTAGGNPPPIAKVDTYEGGLKTSLPMLDLYATVFHNDFTGLSSTTIINNAPSTALGGAKATGVELEGSLHPFGGFKVDGSATYLDATYKNYFTANGTIDTTGNKVQRQPTWQWRVTPSYTLDVGTVKPSVYATVNYYGDRFSDPENKQLLPAFYTLDAGASVTVMDHLQLRVTGTNLTNKIGLTEGNPRIIGSQGQGTILARPILGRAFVFSAAYSF
jgi:iron complex outermembrane recepter protein